MSTTLRSGPSPINGIGMFAKRPLKKGQKVHVSNNTVPLGLNHSCNPNMTDRGYHLKPLRDIQEGEELTLDYQRRGQGPVWFACNCESCRAPST